MIYIIFIMALAAPVFGQSYSIYSDESGTIQHAHTFSNQWQTSGFIDIKSDDTDLGRANITTARWNNIAIQGEGVYFSDIDYGFYRAGIAYFMPNCMIRVYPFTQQRKLIGVVWKANILSCNVVSFIDYNDGPWVSETSVYKSIFDWLTPEVEYRYNDNTNSDEFVVGLTWRK